MTRATDLEAVLRERSATQNIPGYDKKLTACRDAILAGQGLDHVAGYTGGVFDFSVDVLGRHPWFAGLDEDRAREQRDEIRRIGARLVFRVGQLDRRLRYLRTGTLIRCVVHGERGVLFTNQVIADQYLVSAAYDPGPPVVNRPALTRIPYVRTSDRAAAQLSTRLRELVSQAPLNPGGWLTAPADEATDEEELGIGGVLLLRGAAGRIADALRMAVHPDALHYVAYHRDGDLIHAADVFAAETMADFNNRLISTEERRARYDQLGADLGLVALQFGGDTEDTLGGIRRLVLDVELGAIFYYPLPDNAFLVGVTINQSRVSQADDRMADLVGALGRN